MSAEGCWTEDFQDAHERHWEDAELLWEAGRLANADHLYGLSAECGLKYLLLRSGLRLTGRERVHINRLWPHFRRLASTRRLPLPILPGINPFQNWCIDQRYAHRDGFSPDLVRRHRQGAQAVRDCVHKAIIGGLR